MKEEIIKLKPIFEDRSALDIIEKRIKNLFIKEFYYPVLKLLDTPKKIFNSSDNTILMALDSGRIFYSNGKFQGKFSTSISKQLQKYGAKFNRKESSYDIELSQLPFNIRSQISLSQARYEEKLQEIDKRLGELDADKMLEKLDIVSPLVKTMDKVDKGFEESFVPLQKSKTFKETVESLKIVPEFSEHQKEKISVEYENNLEKDIKKFTDEQVIALRKVVQDNVFVKGNRRQVLIKQFMESYNVTENKAKFWARQETNLLMAKYKEAKYTEAGVKEYEWRCVHMPHQTSPKAIYKPGEVRYSHGILEGKIFSWKDPPITTPPGQTQRRNNPGEDYNCRCFALPIIRFKK